MHLHHLTLLLTCALLVACGDKGDDTGAAGTGEGAGDGGTGDGEDGGTGDEGTGGGTGDDGGTGGGPGDDGGTGTGGGTGGDALPLEGFGELSGDCDVLDTELTDAAPSIFVNTLDFGTLTFDYDALSAGGQAVYDAGNLGGSSLYSEIFAYEVLYRCEEAALLQTEGGIVYTDPGGKKTDLLVDLDGEPIGVSVTRAYAWPPEDPYTVEQATTLLEDKLADVLLSSANVGAEHAWTKQVLSVIAYTPDHASSIVTAWSAIDADTRADTIVLVTVTEGDDALLY
jgi:hypothetical protein